MVSHQCSGQFQTVEAVLNERNGRTNKASSTSEERGKQAEADNAEKVEEVMSPSSYVSLCVMELS
jgi:hypothetical protein